MNNSMHLNVDEAINQIVDTESGVTKVVVSAADVHPYGLHQLTVGGDLLPLGEFATETMRQMLAFPQNLEERLSSSTMEYVAEDLWDEAMRRGPAEFVVSQVGDRIEGIARADLTILGNADVLDVVRREAPSGDLSNVRVCELKVDADASFNLGVTFPGLATEPRVGDIVEAGLYVSHSPTGRHATQVSVQMFRLACTNGMLAPVCFEKKSLRVRRTSGADDRRQLLARLNVIIRRGVEQLRDKLTEIERLAQTRADPNPSEELRRIATSRRLNSHLRSQLLDALGADEMGTPGDSRFDVLNALSRVATHGSLTQRQRSELLRFSGVYSQGEHANRCPYCNSFLKFSTQEN